MSSVNYHAYGQNTFSEDRYANQTYNGGGLTTYSTGDSGSGSSNEEGTASSGTGSLSYDSVDSYSLTGTYGLTKNSIGTWGYDFTAAGSYAAGSYVLGNIVDLASNTNSYTLTQTTNESYSGFASTSFNDTGGGAMVMNYGGRTGLGSSSNGRAGMESDTYGGNYSATYVESDVETHTVYMSGSYANGSYNLGSVLYTDDSGIRLRPRRWTSALTAARGIRIRPTRATAPAPATTAVRPRPVRQPTPPT